MNVKVTKSTMVVSAEKTPRGSLWLSRLDLVRRQPYSHTKVLFIYHNPNNNKNNGPSNPSISSFFDIDVLKEALGKALVSFHPMAGRVQLNEKTGRPEIDCNAKGALFIEAETVHALADLGDEMSPNVELRKALLPSCDYSKGLSSFPVSIVQVTRFKCGGVSLGFAQHHHVADGAGHVYFINSWARLARGLDLDVMPVHDRHKYVSPRDPPQIEFDHLHYKRPLPDREMLDKLATTKLREGAFKLTADQINVLRQQAMSPDDDQFGYKLSTFEVLAGHVWRNVCKARGLAKDQDVRLYVPVDGRSILQNPALPQGYCGNVITCAVCIAKAKDIMHNPLWYVASRVHEGLKTMKDSEYFQSAIDYLETMPNMEVLVRDEYSSLCPNLSINSWSKLPYNEADFGWGRPTSLIHRGVRHEGQSFFIPSDDGLLFVIRLFSDHMDLFERYMYEF